MAKVYSKGNSMKLRYHSYFTRANIFQFFSLVILVFWFLNIIFFHIMNPKLLFTLIFVMGFGLIYGGQMRGKANVLKAGIDGEEKARKTIESLPDDYIGFSNLNVTYEGKKSELDMVVVGKTGVFIIETKNYTGEIYGDADAHDLNREKESRSGEIYTSKFYNPIKQVGTHTYRLANYLRAKGIDVWVQGVVYFSNPDVELNIKHISKIPVFDSASELQGYITNYHPKKEISLETIEKIKKILR